MSVNWVVCYTGNLPPGAVTVGRDSDGSLLYAGRALHEGDLLPAKVKPNNCAYVSWGGAEHCKQEYEVLVSSDVNWQRSSGDQIPIQALAVGRTGEGECLYMGRASHEGTLTPGKIQPSHKCLYIPYGGKEIPIRDYEIMVLSPRPVIQVHSNDNSVSAGWVTRYGGQLPPGAVAVGNDSDGSLLYAGRARHEGDLLPAKVKPNVGAYVSWGGAEHYKQQYEVLVRSDVAWERSCDGRVPIQALKVGRTVKGDPLYMGRAYYEGTLTPGKVQPSHKCLYIPYGGKEISIREYDIMVQSDVQSTRTFSEPTSETRISNEGAIFIFVIVFLFIVFVMFDKALK